MQRTLSRARIFFTFLLIIFLFSLFLTVSDFVQDERLSKFLGNLKFYMDYSIEQQATIIPTTLPTSLPTSKPVKTQRTSAPQIKRECYRAVVIHLDGSTSNLCYSKSDSALLYNLRNSYLSAKTFYEFHLESANDYQKTYERTGSSIYLDAKASQEQSAQSEKTKMDQAVAKMQEIEKRGY